MAVQGVEATLFATLMSILNGGSFAGSALGSGLTAAFGVTATNFTLLGPLIAVNILDPESASMVPCIAMLDRLAVWHSARPVYRIHTGSFR